MINHDSFRKSGAFNTILTNKTLIDSCTQYLEYIFFIQNENIKDKLLWFRGVSSEDHLPIPKIQRLERKYEPKLEHFLMTQFVLKARKYNYNLRTKLEWLQVMQHYGLPTRLLDWTEGALIGLFFAVRNENCNIPSVWIMNPLELNRIVTNKNSIYVTDEIVKDTDDSVLDDYLNYDNLPSIPIAISPSYIDQRIQVQKSAFTFHGNGYSELLSKDVGEKLKFFHLRFESNSAHRIKKQLELLGIDESTLFPDLEGIARELEFRFELNRNTWHLEYEKL